MQFQHGSMKLHVDGNLHFLRDQKANAKVSITSVVVNSHFQLL
jgi:hypothetical protein